jgi:hypothetical protein
MTLSDVAAQCMLKGMLAEAATCLKLFLHEHPKDGQALLNFATLCRRTNRLDEAMEMVHRHLDTSTPPLPEVWLIFGLLCEDFGKFEEASIAFKRYQGFKPHDQNAAIAHGSSLMRLQRFDDGFPDWDFGRFLQAWRPPVGLPIWQGEDLKGKRLLIIKEGGYGDAFMFSRWIPQLIAAGAEIGYFVWDSLHPLLANLGCRFIGEKDPIDTTEWDFCCSLLSLPRLCGMHSIADIPPSISIQYWPACSALDLRIGICWEAEENGETRRHRSLYLGDLDPFEQIDAKFFSLCPDTDAPRWMEPYSWGKKTWGQTVALMATLDRVITVDTAVAHLAGSMGVPTWLLLPMYSSWQWFTPEAFPDRTPWYPTMRVFRQKDPLSWKSVIAEVVEALKGSI